jgi:ATP-dependent DNA helicase RecQ
MVDWFLETDACRWTTVLGYLGQPGHTRCGRCDKCRATTFADTAAGGHIVHAEFGEGTIVQRRGDVVVALFEEHGYRTMSETVLVEEGLATLEPAEADTQSP